MLTSGGCERGKILITILQFNRLVFLIHLMNYVVD